jgi:hypothetical protein
LPITDVRVTPVLVESSSRRRPSMFGKLEPGERVMVDAGVGPVSKQQLQAVRFRVDSARVTEKRQ